MNIYDLDKGVELEKANDVARLLGEFHTELLTTPGSQVRTTIRIDDLKLLMRAALDGQISCALYETASLASEELSDIGRLDAAPEIGKAIKAYVNIHPELAQE